MQHIQMLKTFILNIFHHVVLFGMFELDVGLQSSNTKSNRIFTIYEF
jgi:hypothetical protein